MMQSNSDDGQRRLVYIGGTPYLVSPAQMQAAGGSGGGAVGNSGGGAQMQHVFLTPQQQQQQQQPEGMPAGYVMTSLHNSGGQPTVTLVPMAQAGARPSQQVLVLHPTPGSMEMGASAPGQTWVPVLANASRVAYADGGQLPSYHTVVPPSAGGGAAAALSMETLQGVNVVSLPATALAGTAAVAIAAGADGVPLSDPPLHSLPTASRQRAEQCLQHLSIHQRGTARLFVGQIHYDACEDDLYQIFGVYGHVLDVKIMRSGDANAPSSTANSRAEPTAVLGDSGLVPVVVSNSNNNNSSSGSGALMTPPGGLPAALNGPPAVLTSPAPNAPATSNTPANAAASTTTIATAIIGSDSCNDSTFLNPIKPEAESTRICGSASTAPSSALLPPPAPPLPLSTAALATIPLPATNATTQLSNNNSVAISSPKSNRRCNAFVTFSSMIEADTAISALHGRYVMGRDRPLQVTYCQATENISQFGFAHAVRLHKENKNNPLPFKSGAPTHR